MKKRITGVIATVCMFAFILSGCGGTQSTQNTPPAATEKSGTATKAGNADSSTETSKPAESPQQDQIPKEITVMVPPWAEPTADDLKAFKEKTGISAKMNIVGWDEIRDKISIAAVSKTAPADVVEVDWSWVGEFNSSGWVEPIKLKDEDIKDMPTLSSFTVGDNILGVPYANDFRIGFFNKEHFSRAGLSKPPTSWDELVDYCKRIQKAGVAKYPFGLTLSATESTTTSLIWLTLARSGDFFNADGSLNRENVLSSLKFIKEAVAVHKIIDPASATMKDEEIGKAFLNGSSSMLVFSTGYLSLINNEKESKIVNKGEAMLIPGNERVETASFALPEALGVTKYSKNKEAALKFIEWYTGPDMQVSLNASQGTLPTRISVLKKCIDGGQLTGGDIMLKQAASVKSPFPKGIPTWYPEMSTTVYNSVNQMVLGQLTPEKAVEAIDAKIKELSK